MTRVSSRRPRRRSARRGAALSALVALAVAATLVWQSASAGFTDQTGPLGASVGTGTVTVTNSVAGVATVTSGRWKPGASDSDCVAVTSTGSVPAQIRLYVKGLTSTNDAARYFKLEWTAGAGGGANGDCTGFVPNGSPVSYSPTTFPADYSRGVLGWNTAGSTAGETRTYKVTYTLLPEAPVSTKGGSVTLTFVWEARTR